MKTLNRFLYCQLIAVSLFVAARSDVSAQTAITYAPKMIEGWQVNINVLLPIADNSPYQEIIGILQCKLREAAMFLPPKAVAELRKVPIWIELNDSVDTKDPIMSYFPDEDWLQKNKGNVKKARSIEISNAQNFINITKNTNSSLILTALTWAYHDRVLGYNNKEVIAGYDYALKSKLYDTVLNASAQRVRAAALMNERNYFTALSLAYFDVSTYYPFVRAELFVHDPGGYNLIRKLWEAE